ncbi:hypothetical protein BASA81_011153 [Batrachochytrium salamandrivorans]|nr:hypothetical protein BASA81_011153 [Batrachochytrium salamandrivorans]
MTKPPRSGFAAHCLAPVTGGAAYLKNDTFILGLGTNRVSAISPTSSGNSEDLFCGFADALSSVSASVDGATWTGTSLAGEVAMNGQVQWRFPNQIATSSATFGGDCFVGMEFDYVRHLRGDFAEELWKSRTKITVADLALIDQELLVSVGCGGLHLHDLRIKSAASVVKLAGRDLLCVSAMNYTLAVGDDGGGLALLDSRKLSNAVVQEFQLESSPTQRSVTETCFCTSSQLFVGTVSGGLVTIDVDQCLVVRQELGHPVAGLCCSPEGYLLVARDDGFVQLQQV